jgi:TM2 domain-containing membrane protein YozV
LEKNNNHRGQGWVESLLFWYGGFNVFSSIMYVVSEPDDNWKWFSRMALALVLFGFAGIMREIRLNNKNNG